MHKFCACFYKKKKVSIFKSLYLGDSEKSDLMLGKLRDAASPSQARPASHELKVFKVMQIMLLRKLLKSVSILFNANK